MATLGILVNTDRHLRHIRGFTRAALARGHEVSVFLMDAGTRLLQDVSLLDLASLPGVTLSLCDHSARKHGIALEALPSAVVCGSQLNNAMMNHEAERLIVL